MNELSAAGAKSALAAFASPKRAIDLARFFQTAPGQYGEGDKFIGCTVPQSREVAKQFKDLPAADIFELAQSEIHEHRLCALHILVGQFKKAKTAGTRDELFDLWMRLLDAGKINNWDLIDTSAPYLGSWWFDRPEAETELLRLAEHPDLWHRRAAVIFTFAHVRAGDYDIMLKLCEMLLGDGHDLIHKATGWMLREAGNRDIGVLRAFLSKHAATMPRTMLRYAIEKLDPIERREWMSKRAESHARTG
ncbi:MAG: hypothetical protein RL118_1317 [Actinomycetota bacterium]|jgi:3-methyladenine DNA glycosylase AlkD